MSFYQDVRPDSLDTVIGYSNIVKKLQDYAAYYQTGKGRKPPRALAFMGSTSAGKTTLARAFASTVLNNPKIAETGIGMDYVEMNMADSRTIDDMRQLIGQSKLSPMTNRVKIIVLDEYQGVLSNAAAATAGLKMLEDAPPSTLFILCSMEPEKFGSTQNGKATMNRCTKFVLNGLSPDERYKYGVRIVKQQKVDITPEKLRKLTDATEVMRDIANALEGGDSATSDVVDSYDTEVAFLKMIVQKSRGDDIANKMARFVFQNQQKAPGDFLRSLMYAVEGLCKLTAFDGKLGYGVWVGTSAKDMYAVYSDDKEMRAAVNIVYLAKVSKVVTDLVTLSVSGNGVPVKTAIFNELTLLAK